MAVAFLVVVVVVAAPVRVCMVVRGAMAVAFLVVVVVVVAVRVCMAAECVRIRCGDARPGHQNPSTLPYWRSCKLTLRLTLEIA